MSQCVPSWDVDHENNSRNNSNLARNKVSLRAPSGSISSTLDVPTLDYEVAELTWKNGQLAMHGLGPPRVVNKPHANTANLTKYTWDKPHAAETLEAIVNQATLQPKQKSHINIYSDDLVPWLDHHHNSGVTAGTVSASGTVTMDALVPSSNTQPHALSGTNGAPTNCSTRVGSCNGDQSWYGDHMTAQGGAATHEWSSCRDHSGSGSATFGMESSRQLTVETCERELGPKGFTSTSTGSPENTVSGKQQSTKSTSPDEHDSVCHSRPQKNEVDEKKKGKGKSSISTKRSRAAAVHNQSERKRRDKINQKMKTLQKLVPNANKTDKASMLDEVIEYLKQLQGQINMINRMNMSPMMMPLAMQQQQFQMAMMNPMGLGMGMGMGMGMPGVMDLNSISANRPNIHGMPPVFHPSNFMQPTMASWDMNTTSDQVPNHNDQMAAFLACQSQPMTMEGYSRMAAMFQQMQNQPTYPGLKN
ncbi:myc-type, basic helix-loop-helix (bHLH) domain-containing protein [Artemisia annua]|uniref:Myc-type, basic helix-loop-helix (BHLH) domain-containing protein n=1 Tax=Artemisia annua TaxID=35608 RepID=A0A2U1N180_ARTAN|nr:myc-type, basic helix-loop-helix (bHLH) domain-containing protein [Artemisia annua]